jgi:hypothetical protein
MNQPPFEVADVIRAAGENFIEKQRSWLTGLHRKVLSALEHCRTAALGGHRDRCSRCGYTTTAISYNSCRNRHCPKCLNNARKRWLAAREKELLPVQYIHLVFTVPHALVPLFLHNKKLLYSLLLRSSAATLLEVARDPEHLGAEIGFFSVLHTWGQNLLAHPHVHSVIPAGGLSPDHKAWIQPRYRFFLPTGMLSRVFRGKFVAGLKQAFRQGKLCLPGDLQKLTDEKEFRSFLRTMHRHLWVVHAKPPFGGPQYLLNYLARYTHRVAISNHRLVSLADGKVTFRWKDYAHGGQQRLMTLSADEFLRRFLLHTLPRGFVRIRFFGFLANRRRKTWLPICKALLGAKPEEIPSDDSSAPNKRSAWLCPYCSAEMISIQRLTAKQIFEEFLKENTMCDTS